MSDDVLSSDELTERGAWFCANPECVLHVRRGDAEARGLGNWAQLPDGTLTGRGRYGGVMLCDLCGRRSARMRALHTRPARWAPLKVLSLQR